MYSTGRYNHAAFNFMLTIVSLLLLTSCHKKSPLAGKWELIDEKVYCTNPILDSFEKAKIGIHLPGELINKNEVDSAVSHKGYFLFTPDLKYSRRDGQVLDTGNYKMKDSFLLTSTTLLDMSFVTGGYNVHFIDRNNLQLTEDITIKDKSHIHTYVFHLRRSLINK